MSTVTVLRSRVTHPAVRGWPLAVVVYFLAVFHRSSLGVAALLAEQRFGIDAAKLGVFVMLQIGVYAAMQIPTGVLVDRYGPRRLLLAASVLMGVGQLVFAVAPSYGTALFARALLGCGDAMAFISVLRFAAARFSARRYPALVALTGMIGTAGNVLATLPLAILLDHAGWAVSFTGAGLLSMAAAVAVWLFLDDGTVAPGRVRTREQLWTGIGRVNRRVARAWSEPGTRLGYWVHFASMSTATAFGILWGHPYLVDGVGFSPGAAGAVLMVGVLASGAIAPVVGWVIGQHPTLRNPLALFVCVVTVAGWLVTALLLGDEPSRAFVAGLYVFTMFGGPASMVAFALVRDYNDPRVIGTASGVVNVGGFVATVVVALGFGWALTSLGAATPHNLRLALLVPVTVQLFGAFRVAVWYRRVRALVLDRQARGAPIPVPVARRYWWDVGGSATDAVAPESLAS